MLKLKEMLDEYNVFAKSFRMTIERYDKFQKMNLNLQFIVGMKKDRRKGDCIDKINPTNNRLQSCLYRQLPNCNCQLTLS